MAVRVVEVAPDVAEQIDGVEVLDAEEALVAFGVFRNHAAWPSVVQLLQAAREWAQEELAADSEYFTAAEAVVPAAVGDKEDGGRPHLAHRTQPQQRREAGTTR